MNVYYALYQLSTGRILAIGNCDPSIVGKQAQNATQGVVQLAQPVFPMGWYIDITQTPPAPAPRPAATAAIDKTAISANGTDAATLAGLPNPATVTVIGPGIHQSTTVTAGSFAFTTSTPGLYRLYVTAFPMQDFQAAVTAT